MDYATQSRIKIWGTAEVIEDDPDLLTQLTDSKYKGKSERVIRFHVQAWDVNSRLHIPVKYSQHEVDAILRPLIDRLGQLEAENVQLKNPLSMTM